MIDLKDQWCIQIDVTNACTRACSNCTRFVGHIQKPFFMSVNQFSQGVDALCTFPTSSPPSLASPKKMVGIIGGEPLLHPRFSSLAKIIQKKIPERENRGLWTGLNWQDSLYANLIEEIFGYVNNNLHNSKCHHSPILVAAEDVLQDSIKRQKAIDDCWLQKMWSGTITPKGLFFCEVAGAFDILLNGPGGLPVSPDCWKRPLEDFQEQIDRWCHRCGIPLNLEGRIDSEEIDDISSSNLLSLKDSPRIREGNYVLYNPENHRVDKTPWKYLK